MNEDEPFCPWYHPGSPGPHGTDLVRRWERTFR
jgi:hypothetical protein